MYGVEIGVIEAAEVHDVPDAREGSQGSEVCTTFPRHPYSPLQNHL